MQQQTSKDKANELMNLQKLEENLQALKILVIEKVHMIYVFNLYQFHLLEGPWKIIWSLKRGCSFLYEACEMNNNYCIKIREKPVNTKMFWFLIKKFQQRLNNLRVNNSNLLILQIQLLLPRM